MAKVPCRWPLLGIDVDYSWLILTRGLRQDEYAQDWGGVQKDWDDLRGQMIEGDEVWEYECTPDLQHPLSGTAGVCLKRRNEIICHVVTRQTFN